MRIIKYILLWLALSALFSLFNHATAFYEILVETINAFMFTVGFFVSYNFLVKPFLYEGKTGRFILFYFLLTAGLSLISRFCIYKIYVHEKKIFYLKNYWSEPVYYTSNYVLILLVISTLLSFQLLKDRMNTQAKLEELEKEKITTELDFLKAQINPHFLFNSLNNILFQIDRTNKDARETLLKFSEMLRYQLYDCSTDLIDIEKELQYIRNYIEIQMLRKTEKYDCNLTVSDSVKNFRIAPLLLIPFIENAFKHVSNHSHKKNCIDIKMDCNGNNFTFIVKNDRDMLVPVEISESKGIGLANVQRRLDLLYKDQHELEILKTDTEYSVHLKMKVALS